MAYMNTGQFDTLCFGNSEGEGIRAKKGNWPLLNRTWSRFLTWLGDKWWGSVSEAQIESFLNRPEVNAGAIVIANYFGSAVGAVCSVVVKTDSGNIRFAVIVERGRYQCANFVQWHFWKPDALIRELIEEVKGRCGEARLVSKPQEVTEDPTRFSATRLVRDMRGMITSIGGSWWGVSNYRTGCSEHQKMVDTLKKMSISHSNPAAVVCFMDEHETGYLFDIFTADTTYIITFDPSGYNLTYSLTVHFATLTELLNYMSAKVTFVTRPIPDASTVHDD